MFSLKKFLPLIGGLSNEQSICQKLSVEATIPDRGTVIHHHRNAVESASPINRLVADIFFLTLLNDQDPYIADLPPLRRFRALSFSPGSASDPMRLAQVCRHWRGVTLSTPMLWSSMSILCAANTRQHVPLLQTWLERSGTCPLTIVLVETSLGREHWNHRENPKERKKRENRERQRRQQDTVATEILSLLMTQAYRWKSIDFRFEINLPRVLANLPVGSLEILESATILSRKVSTFDRDLVSLNKFWHVIHSSPSFHRGQWEFDYLKHTYRTIPWTRLTCIEVTMSNGSLFEVLPLCHNLMDLRFTHPTFAYGPLYAPEIQSSNHSHSPILLRCLRNLSVAVVQAPDAIFQRLTLPSLTSFSIRRWGDCRDRPDPALLEDLLARSQCRLQKFSYQGPDDEDFFSRILVSPVMSDIIDLKVECRVTSKLIGLLTPLPGVCVTLPRLERLILWKCTTPPGVLLRMVSSRRSKSDDFSLLQEIQVRCPEEANQVDLEGIKVLAAHEMSFRGY